LITKTQVHNYDDQELQYVHESIQELSDANIVEMVAISYGFINLFSVHLLRFKAEDGISLAKWSGYNKVE